MPHDVLIIIIMCIVGLEKTARYEWEAWKCLWCWLPIVLLWFYICWTWKRCWGVNEGGIVFGKNTHWLGTILASCYSLSQHPLRLKTKVFQKNGQNRVGTMVTITMCSFPTQSQHICTKAKMFNIQKNWSGSLEHWWSLQYALLPANIIGYIWKTS